MTDAVARELQINAHPNDVRHFEPIFEHNMRVWGLAVDRVRLTVDINNSQNGRYHSKGFSDNYSAFQQLTDRLKQAYPKLVVDYVDYSPEARTAVARHFFGREHVPIKAWDGGPFFSYLYGLWTVDARSVVHMDSDMMFGGLSRTWLDEAEARLDADQRLVFVAPLAGPPLLSDLAHSGADISNIYDSVSTRIFMTRPALMRERLGTLPLESPGLMRRAKAWLLGNEGEAFEFENILSATMRARGVARLELLGSSPGLWSLHPPYRNANFYKTLPELIERIERNDIPDGQRGDYNLGDTMCDWSDARASEVRWKRLWRQFKRAVELRLPSAEGPAR